MLPDGNRRNSCRSSHGVEPFQTREGLVESSKNALALLYQKTGPPVPESCNVSGEGSVDFCAHHGAWSTREMERTDRQRGALIGLAVGDALGAPIEFEPPGAFVPIDGFRGGGPHGLRAGEWTDDTSMALALADSIAECGWDIDDQAERYVAWWRTAKYSSNGRVFDIGNATVAALCRFVDTGDARTSGGTREHESGNGSIMRLAPVPIRYVYMFPQGIDDLIERAVESSLPTHATLQCRGACAYFCLILVGLIAGLSREEVLKPEWGPIVHLRQVLSLHPDLATVVDGSYRERKPPEIRGSGYVVESLEAALWAFHDADDFEQAVLRAVNLGDDADTTGAVCGQLAGAFWGHSGIPQRWLAGLARSDLIEDVLSRLIAQT